MAERNEVNWYGVRCVYRYPNARAEAGVPGKHLDIFEERVTVWQATCFEDAIAKAEEEGDDYASTLECERTELSQAYLIGEGLEAGAEVFSLMRESALPTPEYLDRYFDDGKERQSGLSSRATQPDGLDGKGEAEA